MINKIVQDKTLMYLFFFLLLLVPHVDTNEYDKDVNNDEENQETGYGQQNIGEYR